MEFINCDSIAFNFFRIIRLIIDPESQWRLLGLNQKMIPFVSFSFFARIAKRLRQFLNRLICIVIRVILNFNHCSSVISRVHLRDEADILGSQQFLLWPWWWYIRYISICFLIELIEQFCNMLVSIYRLYLRENIRFCSIVFSILYYLRKLTIFNVSFKSNLCHWFRSIIS